FGDEEKEGFRLVMRRIARFSGVQVLTYAVMDNHFHILARVPSRKRFLKRFEDAESDYEGAGEERFLEHLLILYSKAYVAQVRREIAHMRERGMEDDVQAFLDKYKQRFCNLSLFVKEVKERFSRWFNKKHERRGTLWMDRFKSVLVEDGEALRTMSAYIDLNAVRAGIVEDPKDYRWCGYAEAVAGSKQARRGLCQVMERPQDSWSSTAVNQSGKRGSGAWYRCWLMTDGEEVVVDETNRGYHVKPKVGIPKEEVEKALARGGLLTTPELLRCKIRYFTEGIAIGGKGFVNEWYGKYRAHFSPKREKGAKAIPSIEKVGKGQSVLIEKRGRALYTLKGKLEVMRE
ncbi:MAG: transposase, partial [Methylococcales bacterium]|nr:transposase [Methylococcales bacterium]